MIGNEQSDSDQLGGDLDPSLGVEVVRYLSIVLEIDESSESNLDISMLRDIVAERIREIVDNQFGRLPALLYRFDVDERRVKEIFQQTPVASIPEALADLIIERSLLRMKTRREYREGRSDEEQPGDII
jgi:hypothetical protein